MVHASNNYQSIHQRAVVPKRLKYLGRANKIGEHNDPPRKYRSRSLPKRDTKWLNHTPGLGSSQNFQREKGTKVVHNIMSSKVLVLQNKGDYNST